MKNCPICQRELGDIAVDKHHLIPKTFKGKDTIDLHKICHRKIHTVWTERELCNYYHTVERIVEYDEIIKFIKWVKKKEPSYYDSSKDTKSRKSKRRR